MKLTAWLAQAGLTRIELARRLGVSPAAVTQLCNNETPWLSRETAETLLRVTEGAVTPNDFIGLPAQKETLVTKAVSEAVAALARGEIIIVTDDDDRENEGDLICAASLCTPEKMAFIIRHTCGIVCAPLTAAEARRLRLDPMVNGNDAPLGTNFTVTVDVRHGLTTGISAEQRSNTVRALANNNMGPGDFVRPGHVFPLIARDGGVLMRSGHTEAAVDLCKLGGLPPVGVICELANDDGTVMKGAQIQAFADLHGLKRISVADIIAYRQMREKLVERVSTFQVESEVGTLTGHAYVTPFDSVQHFAFTLGEIGEGLNVPTRLHRANVIADVFGGAPLIHRALNQMAAEGRGVLLYLRDGTAGVPATVTGDDDSSEAQRTRQWREIGLGAQILRDLGVVSIRHLVSKASSASGLSYVGVSGFGIEIAETVTLGDQA